MTTSVAQQLSQQELDLIFREARTFSAWLPQTVEPAVLRQIYDLAKLPPTSANSQPARFVFLTTPESKARLLPLLAPANLEKTRTAPVTAIIADTETNAHTFPHTECSFRMGAAEDCELSGDSRLTRRNPRLETAA